MKGGKLLPMIVHFYFCFLGMNWPRVYSTVFDSKNFISFYDIEISRYQELIRCIMNAKLCNRDKKGMKIPDYLVFIKSLES